MSGHLDNSGFAMIVLGILVKRLGGEVQITQADIDDVAYCRLLECDSPTQGTLTFTFEQRTSQ